jgi:hypothetical protein
MSLAVRIASEFHRDVTRQIQWYLRHADAQIEATTPMQWVRHWNSLADFQSLVRAAVSSIPNSANCGSIASRAPSTAIKFSIA